ncbi:MAG TPA: LuxR family transcriptional regulator [Rhizobiales bacterium]|nr:LuxR family transcriptional regulator [Hyphomicrobiales bacterium]
MKIWEEVARLEQQESVEELWAVLLKALSDLGFDYAIYLTIGADGEEALMRSNIPQIYDLIQVKDDPFFEHCCNSYEPIFTGIEFAQGYEALTEEELEFIRQASVATGFISGVALPMRLSGSERYGGFNLGTRLKRDDFLAKIEDQLEPLRFLCLIAHRRIEEICHGLVNGSANGKADFRSLLVAPQISDDVQLSPREREVIYLFSQGLSTKECAIACNISPNTVAEYSKNAYKKLSARNRVEAVNRFFELNQSDG